MPNDDDSVALKRRRAIILGSCTRIRTFIDAVEAVTPSVWAQLEERKNKIEVFWAEYDVVQTKLELIDIVEADHRASFEDAYYATTAKLRELLNPPFAPRSQPVPSTSSASAASEHFNHLKLPKLDLPKFSGKYDEWFPFFDTFNSLIHANISLSNIQKLQYLRASLTCEASNIICALEISEANYEVAWNLLKERYDNKRIIVQGHVRAILNLPSITKENIVELRQIADGATKHIHALQALKRPVSHWDDLLVHILSNKLDALTLREWQLSLTGSEIPTLKQFIDFISHRCQTLETNSKLNVTSSKHASALSQSNARRQSSCVATVKTRCAFCKGEHLIYYCQDFLALPVSQRISEIRKRRICTNCLRSTEHASSKCLSGSCKICKLKHNSLLHLATVAPVKPAVPGFDNNAMNENGGRVPANTPAALVTHSASAFDNKYIMLSTAIVYAYDNQGSRKSCRVLLDSGSQANFISQKLLGALGLKTRPLDISISGINKTATRSFRATEVKLQSRTSSFSVSLDCIVTDHVTDKIPATSFKRGAFEIPQNIELADPQFHVSAEIDVLIGAEHFWNLLCVGQVKSSPMHPTLHKTRFGWVLAGQLGASQNSAQKVQSFHTTITDAQLHNQLSRFWQLEDVAEISNNYSDEEARCEQHFLQNVSRNSQGRFIVKLPFKEQALDLLGESKDIALKRFRNLEKRFIRDPKLKIQYSQFINEYLALGHMKLIDEQQDDSAESFYLPHHCVFKPTAGSNKIRVVFDASSKGSTGISLNDALMIGPTVQQDLVSILLRFRTFRFVLAADIIKMYRQIMVHPSQTRYQRILWRDDPSSEIKTYELVTVTYGTSSASYLATRCLKWLAEKYANDFPSGSTCVGRDFYVDDVLTGADTLDEAKTVREQTIELLRLGAFKLSKWASNCPELLANINGQDDGVFTIDTGMESSILGVHWNQLQDTFHFSYKPDDNQSTVSKRLILSEVSRLFDPLGLLGPVIVLAKLILQELWQLGIHWDESVPQDLHSRWTKFKFELTSINEICIPRCVKLDSNPNSIEVHGFCDASERAYGASIYVRTKLGNDAYHTELLCSKSRVAPLKAVSLPRLELLAAVLLARLIRVVNTAFSLSGIKIFLWSDSTIVLNWISSSSRGWSTFVANRIGEIQEATDPDSWRHVRSLENPADVLSRGLNPRELANLSMWWHGPEFLKLSEELWPNFEFRRTLEDMPERRTCSAAVAVIEYSVVNELLNKYSRLSKACRILAYCLRLSRAFRPAAPTIFISHQEILSALKIMCRSVQFQAFSEEYKALSKSRDINASSRILSLSPFMDKDRLIRVGGRLDNSNLDFDTQHPILLPRSHILTQRIIEQEHVRNAHAGAQATIAAVRQRFWPISIRSVTRKILKNCVTCFKMKPVHSEAIMGSLPAGRVNVSKPFSHCGVDYAGPFMIRESKRRNAKNHKAYLSIFVCFATRGVHLDLVSDLTSDSFIATLKRFVSRRGKPSCIYSDNGTTFVGAQRQLKEFFDFLCQNQVQSDINCFLRDHETSWKFIPPNAPHFGGLWEAAVKSAKYHLQRIAGKLPLTFEELQTIFCEVEAILNSRPLVPLSEDPNDLSYLSPGHFLIGTTLNSFPYNDLTDVSENRLVRWQRVEQVRQHFWRRWSQEYLHTLQERTKWKVSKGEQLKLKQMVLLKSQGLAPLQWSLGRVEEVHPGPDNIVRTATIRTARGLFTRPLAKIAILPIEE